MALPEPWEEVHVSDRGVGGQAEVFHVKRPGDANTYALKRLKNAGSEARRQRFATEIGTMSDLRDAGVRCIPEVMESGLDTRDRPYFVMPWYPAGTVQDMHDEGRLGSPAESILLLVQVARCMDLIHSRLLAHRDLKPANLLVDDQTVAIADFGLCLDLEVGSRLTETTERIGAYHYIAPENQGGFNPAADHRPADLYAFGKIAWMIVSRRPVVPREDERLEANWLSNIVGPEYAPLDSLIDELLQVDPAARAAAATWERIISEFTALIRLLQRPGPQPATPSAERSALVSEIGRSDIVRELRQVEESRRTLTRRITRSREWLRGHVRESLAAEFASLDQELRPDFDVRVSYGGFSSIDISEIRATIPNGREESLLVSVTDTDGAQDQCPAVFVVVPQQLPGIPPLAVRLALLNTADDEAVVATYADSNRSRGGHLVDAFSIRGPFRWDSAEMREQCLEALEFAKEAFDALLIVYLTAIRAGRDLNDNAGWAADEAT